MQRFKMIIASGVLAALALMLASVLSPAVAADKGGPKAPAQTSWLEPPEPLVNSPWTGCWMGVKLSYTMQSTEIGPVSFDAKDAAVGPRGGCDVQIKGSSLVFGLMGDAEWTRADSAIEKVNFAWFAGGRAGLLLSDKTMLYGLVGYTSVDGSALTAIPANHKGLTLGVGAQTKLTKSLDLMAEWRRVDLGSDLAGKFIADHSQNSVGVSLVYRFNAQ